MADHKDEEKQMLRASSGTDAKKLASSIVAHYQNHQDCRSVVIRAIGASAVNQAIKAVIIANKYFVRKGQVLSIIPGFNDLEENGVKITSIELTTKFVNF